MVNKGHKHFCADWSPAVLTSASAGSAR